VDIASHRFSEPKNPEELEFVVRYAAERGLNHFVIGEGSNLLFTAGFEGLIIHPVLEGIDVVDESATEVLIRAGAGVNWDSFVQYCVSHHWHGAENLSLIPGSVGAAPVQNIGAYGVEARDIVEYAEVFDVQEMMPVILSNAACEFGYRDSIFKHNSGRYIVTYVVFRLQKEGEMNLEYGNVKEVFLQSKEQNLQALRETIIAIREEKLPDPSVTGNAGSFFKNPAIRQEKFVEIQKEFQDVPGYKAGPERVKVPAAWLIEQSGWKGVREGNVGTWPSQPLVIVNYGGAAGQDIFVFSEKIRAAVCDKFGIMLEREVIVIGPAPE